MAITAKLELKQGQQLVMTPQLQQAIKLLQLSNLELSEFVETELERNPLLERDEDEGGPNETVANGEAPSRDSLNGANGQAQADGETTGSGPEGEDWVDLESTKDHSGEVLDTSYDNVFPEDSGADMASDWSGDANATGVDGLADRTWSEVRSTVGGGGDEAAPNLESYLSSATSLKDYLTNQLPLVLNTPAEHLIGSYLVDLVDDAGYLNADLEDLSEKLGIETNAVEGVLEALQTLDPPGVFARSLAECLALQLKDRNRYDPQIAALLENLHLLAEHNVAKLRRVVDCDMDELSEMIAEIKELHPKPGLQFGFEPMQPVVPDVLVRQSRDGGWIVELNSETLPRVLVNRTYYAKVSNTARTEGERDYLVDCLQNANWLVKSLDQRARTILRVAEEIVRQQDGFFAHGVQHLRPLNLKTVADAISMHESTISRVTSNKYMATARGIFELKYFFTSAIASSADGEAHSSEAVRHRIRQLVDGESVKSILSDDKIVELLRAEGIDIARRTVAKYREAMRIPSSVQRRREKRLSAQMAKSA